MKINPLKIATIFVLGFSIFLFNACEEKEPESSILKISAAENEAAFQAVLTKHLNAVTNKDTTALRATLSPKGNMELIQYKTETIHSVDTFMEIQAAWFQVPNWSFETKIESMNVGERIGVATTETIYREPDRDGKAYFNRMNISYTLEKIDGIWYVIKDHASSVEKSTDTE